MISQEPLWGWTWTLTPALPRTPSLKTTLTSTAPISPLRSLPMGFMILAGGWLIVCTEIVTKLWILVSCYISLLEEFNLSFLCVCFLLYIISKRLGLLAVSLHPFSQMSKLAYCIVKARGDICNNTGTPENVSVWCTFLTVQLQTFMLCGVLR